MRKGTSIRGSTEYEKKFIGIFNRLCDRHRSWQVWQDFVNVSACSIANAADRRPKIQKTREDLYMETIKRYSKEEQNLLCELLSITVLALDENPAQDFLGTLYTRFDFGSKQNGQFFTPWHVAELMARLQIDDDLKDQIAAKGYISINDPCCGAGGLLIAFAKVCKDDMDINYQQSVLFVGQDIDEVVAKMCYIQVSLLGCPGYVIIGNSLSEPISGNVLQPSYKKPENIWFTPLYFTSVWSLRRFIYENGNPKNKSEEPKPILMPETKLSNASPSERKAMQKPIVKKSANKKKLFSWKDFFTVKGKGKR